VKTAMSEGLETSTHRQDKATPPVDGPSTSTSSEKGGILRKALRFTEGEFTFLKSLTFLSIFGTLIGAYFQYLSTYQDKVSTLAKEDLAAATSIFTRASTALSVPLSLQERLVLGYYDAIKNNVDTDPASSETRSAHDLEVAYEGAYTSLR